MQDAIVKNMSLNAFVVKDLQIASVAYQNHSDDRFDINISPLKFIRLTLQNWTASCDHQTMLAVHSHAREPRHAAGLCLSTSWEIQTPSPIF